MKRASARTQSPAPATTSLSRSPRSRPPSRWTGPRSSGSARWPRTALWRRWQPRSRGWVPGCATTSWSRPRPRSPGSRRRARNSRSGGRWSRGKEAALSGRVPRHVDPATKASLLDLVDPRACAGSFPLQTSTSGRCRSRQVAAASVPGLGGRVHAQQHLDLRHQMPTSAVDVLCRAPLSPNTALAFDIPRQVDIGRVKGRARRPLSPISRRHGTDSGISSRR